MKHLKFIFLSYTLLNICSVFASDDPINHDDLSPKSAELVSEVNTQEVQNNASDVISNNKNKKTIKGNADSDKFIPQYLTFDGFLDYVFYSKTVITNREIARRANSFYYSCKNDDFADDALTELELEVTENIIPEIVLSFDDTISYTDIVEDARLLCFCKFVKGKKKSPDNPEKWISYIKYPADVSHLAGLNKKGTKYSRRFRNLIRVIRRIAKLLRHYPE